MAACGAVACEERAEVAEGAQSCSFLVCSRVLFPSCAHCPLATTCLNACSCTPACHAFHAHLRVAHRTASLSTAAPELCLPAPRPVHQLHWRCRLAAAAAAPPPCSAQRPGTAAHQYCAGVPQAHRPAPKPAAPRAQHCSAASPAHGNGQQAWGAVMCMARHALRCVHHA